MRRCPLFLVQHCARGEFDVLSVLAGLKNIKAVFLEEFVDHHHEREPGRFNVFHVSDRGWRAYSFGQQFSTARVSQGTIHDFVSDYEQRRILGGCCVLLCGESNVVKYSKADKNIYDAFELRKKFRTTLLFLIQSMTA